MPTYEYRCPEGHDFEKFVLKISDAKSELPCPTCGLVAARRVSAGAGLLFKGSGFYITDYGKDGKKDQQAAATKKAEGASADAGGTKKEPAAAASAAPAPAAKAATKDAPATAASSSPPKPGPAK